MGRLRGLAGPVGRVGVGQQIATARWSCQPARDQGSLGQAEKRGVSDGTRTRGILDHNQVLYQLSYTHHATAPTALRTMVAGAALGVTAWAPLE